MSIMKTLLIGITLVFSTNAFAAHKSCYKLIGTIDGPTSANLKLSQSPGFACITPEWAPGVTLIEIMNKTATTLGFFEATLQRQVRCFHCLDAEYTVSKFYNSERRTTTPLSLNIKTSGELDLRTKQLRNGMFAIGNTSFLMETFPAL